MPDGWAWTKAKCLYNIRSAIRIHQTDWQSSGIPFFRGRELVELCKTGKVHPEIYISEELYEQNKSKGGIPQKNDLLVSAVGTLGFVHIVEGTKKFYYKDAYILCFENKFNLNPKYTKLVIESDYTQKVIYGGSKGTTVDQLTIENAKELWIPFPPLSEQEKIVSQVENIFLQVHNLEQDKSDLQTIIKQTKSKILDLAIHGKLVPQDPNDEPAEELLKRIATSDNRPYENMESSEIDWTLTNNWCLCHFGDIATVINGKNQSKVENPDGKYPIYGSGGIMGRADDYICPENCTIIGRKGSINNPIFVEEKFWNVDTAFGLCPSEAVLPKFLYYFCEYFDFTTLDSSTTLPSLTKTNIQQIVLALPPIDEQKRILDKIVELFGILDEIVLNLA